MDSVNKKIAELVWLYLTLSKINQEILWLGMKYNMSYEDIMKLKRLVWTK